MSEHKLSNRVREVPMRVIVHGLHRTGSMSTRTALHQLGLFTCYHMVNVLDKLDTDPELWARAIEAKFAADAPSPAQKWTREDWDELLGECQACLDVPAALFTLELAEAYPEAKVVLLNRDPEKWYESVLGSVNRLLAPPPSLLNRLWNLYLTALVPRHRQWTRLAGALRRYGMPFDHAREKDKAIAWFNDSYRQVREAIPPERRLEFSVKDGFRPLCEFLDLPVPMVRDEQTGEMVDAPFPHLNDRSSFATYVRWVKGLRIREANAALLTLVCKAVTAAVVGYAGYHVYVWKIRPFSGWGF
ncbi:hypothetical protein E4U54_007543 [Claviceps lovelessii]|nr:hypothetical protein E4U54_007543 [Claviceps lovelessii]